MIPCRRNIRRTKRRLRKFSTSETFDGPPIFNRTMAVGPLEPFLGTEVAVANPCPFNGRLTSRVAGRALWEALLEIMRHGRVREVRIAILNEMSQLKL